MTDYDEIARRLADTHASPYPPSYIPAAAAAIAEALRNADAAGRAAGVADERERCARIAARYSSMKRRWQRKVDRLGLQNGGALARAQSDAAQEILKAICATEETS